MLHVISGTGDQHGHQNVCDISSFLFQNIAKNNSSAFRNKILIPIPVLLTFIYI
jgi:hypothetical protein